MGVTEQLSQGDVANLGVDIGADKGTEIIGGGQLARPLHGGWGIDIGKRPKRSRVH